VDFKSMMLISEWWNWDTKKPEFFSNLERYRLE